MKVNINGFDVDMEEKDLISLFKLGKKEQISEQLTEMSVSTGVSITTLPSSSEDRLTSRGHIRADSMKVTRMSIMFGTRPGFLFR